MTVDDIPVSRAIFGDVGGAHNLIAASPGLPEALLNDLAAHYTDRLLSSEHAWSTYRCGFPVKGYYVLTQTFPVKASRGGMVQTHAVMVSLDRVGGLEDLEPLVHLLPTKPVSEDAVEAAVAPITLTTRSSELTRSNPPGYRSVIRMLLQDRVPVWVGQPGFWEVVAHLWRNLWPAARKELHFRVASEPNDLGPSVTLLCTLKETRTSWDVRSIVNSVTPITDAPTAAEALLEGAPESQELANARARLGFSQPKISDIKRLVEFVHQLREGSANSVRSAARILGQLAPASAEVPDEKTTILRRLASLTAQGSEADVLGLRNFNINAFPGATDELRGAIRNWMRERVRTGAGGLEIAREIFLNKHAWDDFARPAVVDAFSPWDDSHANILWTWWIDDCNLIERTSFLLPPQNATLEQELIRFSPESLPATSREPLLGIARQQRWYQLHAMVLTKAPEISAQERFRQQIQFDADHTHFAGLRRLAEATEPRILVEVAVEIGDARLIRLAADAVCREPQLLQTLDPRIENWRQIWALAVASHGDLYQGVRNAQEAGFGLLSAAVEGGNCPGVLLERVVIDPRTDLQAYPRRAELWSLLKSPIVRESALRQVAAQWLEAFLSEERFESAQIEQDIESLVLKRWVEIRRAHPAASVLRMHRRFDALREEDLVGWLSESPQARSNLDAIALGDLIANERWKRAAERLADVVLRSRGSLDAAIYRCVGLLPRIQKIKVRFFVPDVEISEDEWWDEFVHQASDLFPSGISDSNIWQVSGGDLSLISQNASGRDQWTNALNLLRRGGGGRITIRGLLHQMRNCFWYNSELKALEDAFLRGIG